MEVEVKESLTGAFVPLHLLDFKGNPELQSYYRKYEGHDKTFQPTLVPFKGKKTEKLDLGQCQLCFSKLLAEDHPRLTSGRKRTKQINKLMFKASQEKYISKFGNKTLQNFFSSPQNLTVRCKECLHTNTKAIMTNRELIELKKRHRSKVAGLISNNDEVEPKISRKKRKKLKRKARLQAAEKLEGEATPTALLEGPARVETTMTDIKSAIATDSQSQSRSRTPSSSIPQISNKIPVSKFLPSSRPNVPKHEGGAQGRERSSDSVLGKNRKQSKHKQLQAFLKANEQEKPSSSLSDFLASL